MLLSPVRKILIYFFGSTLLIRKHYLRTHGLYERKLERAGSAMVSAPVVEPPARVRFPSGTCPGVAPGAEACVRGECECVWWCECLGMARPETTRVVSSALSPVNAGV